MIIIIIYLLSWNKGFTPIRLVLIGIGIATAMGAITKMMLLFSSIYVSRKLVGRSYGSLLPVSLFIGGLIVVIADLIGRTAFLPSDIPAGVFTSGIGAPFFIYLLFRNNKS